MTEHKWERAKKGRRIRKGKRRIKPSHAIASCPINTDKSLYPLSIAVL